MGINPDQGRIHRGFIGHDGQMQGQPGVAISPDTPVSESDRREQRYLPASSFRSRRAALSDAQRKVWERRWPDLGLSLGTAPEGRQESPLDTGAWFGRRAPVVLEIGCGSGTSTLAMAKDEPGIDVVAVEIYRRGLAQLLSGIDRDQIGNIRLIRGNGIEVLQRLIAPDSLTGVRVFFPDPWPKARHHKRRFLQTGTIGLIADRLLPGGVLHVATDHAGCIARLLAAGCRSRPAARSPSTRRRAATRAASSTSSSG